MMTGDSHQAPAQRPDDARESKHYTRHINCSPPAGGEQRAAPPAPGCHGVGQPPVDREHGVTP